jgi:hypothetical protein
MRHIAALIFCCFVLASCAKVETATDEKVETNSNKITLASPIIESNSLLKPTTPKIKLNSKQQKYLDKSLPPNVREILEKAEKLEILAEVGEREETETKLTTFEPNRIAKIPSEDVKKEILETFYVDASSDDSAASCYEPHHGLRATYQGKRLEVEVCFDCARFYVKGSLGNFEGTIRRENRKSEKVFNRIIQNQSVEIK